MKTSEKKFETALEELETLVSKLESEQLSLEESLSLFEKGVSLSKLCSVKLQEAEKKVDSLLQDLSKELTKETKDPNPSSEAHE